MSFKEWLMHFKDVDRPIGDLANDIAKDGCFPDTSDKEKILEHLEQHNAMDAAIITFEYVYSFYKEDTKD
ncbi:YozE family protein [Virgibacillus salarius]|uniref:YozE family protein n=1 Tax=Virgibacillus salarius TaxID=447199 RepID=UPI002491640A|nr:YozE family protein [Virgibacillus salarius]WBX80154.1 YozE family protein [Virgibacillus salarius]